MRSVDGSIVCKLAFIHVRFEAHFKPFLLPEDGINLVNLNEVLQPYQNLAMVYCMWTACPFEVPEGFHSSLWFRSMESEKYCLKHLDSNFTLYKFVPKPFNLLLMIPSKFPLSFCSSQCGSVQSKSSSCYGCVSIYLVLSSGQDGRVISQTPAMNTPQVFANNVG